MIPVKIADIPIRMSCQDTEFFTRRLADYLYPDIDAAETVMTINSSCCCTVELEPAEPVTKIRAITLMKTPDGRLYYYSVNKDGHVICSTAFDPEYLKVDIRQRASRCHPVFSLTDFEYMYTGMAFGNRLAVEGGLVFHASALSYQGQGIAFSAVSGTGKSTHTGLWKQYLGDDVVIVNDDKPAIRILDNQPYLYGTPWSGKTDINSNCRVPLKAIVFLEQAPENRLVRLSPADAYFDMINGIARPSYDEPLSIRLLDTMDRLLSAVPLYKLSCNISRDAVRTVYEEIIGGLMP